MLEQKRKGERDGRLWEIQLNLSRTNEAMDNTVLELYAKESNTLRRVLMQGWLEVVI